MAEESRKISILSVLVCAFFSFNLCLFGPLEIYLTNITEFWFSIDELIKVTTICFLLVFIILFIICFIAKDRVYKVIICLIFGLGLAFYVQGNFLKVHYGLMDGSEINWDQYGSWGVANTAIWIICIILPLLLFKIKANLTYKIIEFGSMFIVSIQLITLIVLLIITPLEKGDIYLSEEGEFSLSNNENVVVFVLDMFDNDYLEELLTKDQSIPKQLEGFTYFRNTVGSYQTTKGAIPFIITGQYYKNEQLYSDYIENSFQKTNFYNDLLNNDFDTRIFTYPMFFTPAQSDIISNIERDRMRISSHLKLTELMYRFTAFRYMPHYLKQYFWLHSGKFDNLKRADEDKPNAYSLDNISFYSTMKDKRLEISTQYKNGYRLYHLVGAHYPYTMNEKVELVSEGEVTYLETARGCINIVSEYLNQLKELGIYDNTTVIITADHGEFTRMPSNPILLVKPKEKTTGFTVSEAPVSIADIHATIMSQIVRDYDKYGNSVFDVPENMERERMYYMFARDIFASSDYLPDLTEYIVKGDANNKLSYFPTGKLYTKEGLLDYSSTVKFGENLLFDANVETDLKFDLAFYNKEGSVAWTKGKSGKISFLFQETPTRDLNVTFKIIAVQNNEQKLIVKCAGEKIFDSIVTKPGEITLSISNELIKEKELILDLEYPDAVSPVSLGKGSDERILAFAFAGIVIEESEEESIYNLGEEIFFTEKGGSEKYFITGLWPSEGTIRWSKDTYGLIRLKLSEIPTGDLKVTFLIAAVHTGQQTLIVKYQNNILLNTVITEPGPITFSIPYEFVKDRELALDLDYPDAVSPASLGTNGDQRILAFAFTSMKFEEDK